MLPIRKIKSSVRKGATHKWFLIRAVYSLKNNLPDSSNLKEMLKNLRGKNI